MIAIVKFLKAKTNFNVMRWAKIRPFLIGGVIFLVIVGTWFVYTIDKAFNDMCRNQLLAEIPSPDKVYRVIVFQRDCGATTGCSTQVSVLKSKEKLQNVSGNLFIANTDYGKAPSGTGGGPAVKISWIDSRSILLIHHKDARVFFANPRVFEVSAIYDYLK